MSAFYWLNLCVNATRGSEPQWAENASIELDGLRRELAEAQAENASLREIIEASGVDADEVLAAQEGER